MRWLPASLMGACAFVFVGSASAQEHRAIEDALSVVYEGKCLDHNSLTSAVAQWLGGGSVDSDLAVFVKGADKPVPHARFELRRLNEAIAVRRFQGLKRGCEDLQKALPFAIAIAIDARVVQARDASLPVPTARPDESAAPEPQPEPEPLPEPEPPAPVEVKKTLQATPVLTAQHISPQPSRQAFKLIVQTHWLRAVAPQAAWAAQVGVSWQAMRWLELELGALASLPDTAALASGEASFSVAGTVVQACARHVSAVIARACIGGAGGVVRANGAGYADDLGATGAWWSGIGGVDAAWPPRSRLAVRISGQILPAVRRPALAVRDMNAAEVGRLHAPRVGATLALGLSLAL